jgi:hypothetical protein
MRTGIPLAAEVLALLETEAAALNVALPQLYSAPIAGRA